MLWNNPGQELDLVGKIFEKKKKIIFYGISNKIITICKKSIIFRM